LIKGINTSIKEDMHVNWFLIIIDRLQPGFDYPPLPFVS